MEYKLHNKYNKINNMELYMNESNHNFVIKESRFIKEINANVNIYLHKRTGARLLHIDADDNNKVFTVGFRTPPVDHTGVAHIMEHSVLCGSAKYPTKEPFVELLKGSLYTFLNAMTAQDFTLYPVASMNNEDFKILMQVYLDAVFFPNVHTTDEIFEQEGWHYELLNKEDNLNVKGVVYNEMKGAYSSPIRILSQKVSEVLFPDTAVRFSSGGIPEHIPELSIEQFREFHNKYYHPSNSYIYLYGKMDINEMLHLINDEALNRFGSLNIDSSVDYQHKFKEPVVSQCTYPISDNENEKDKTWFSLSFVLDLKENPALIFAFEVIAHFLLETPAAPLKNAILKAGIAKDVFGYFDGMGKQPTFTVILKDSNPENQDKFKELFFNTLKDLCEKGIDKQLIEASINIKEFNLREADMGGFPKGLMYIYHSISDWIHDKDPINSLAYEEVLSEVKLGLKDKYFESLIENFILKNNHYALVEMKPEKGLAEKNYKEFVQKLVEIKENMSEDEINKIIANTKKLLQRQDTPDTIEDLEKIPVLTLDDVNPKAEDFSFKYNKVVDNSIPDVKDLELKYLEHPCFTNGIAYLKLYFDTNTLTQDLVPYASLLTTILGKIHTKKYHYAELSNLINIHTGGFEFDYNNYSDYHDDDKYKALFTVNSKALMPKINYLVEFLIELTQNTVFTDENQLKDILNETKSRYEMSLMQNGHTFAGRRLNAYFSEAGKFDEVIEGVEMYLFIKNILQNFDTNKEEIIKNIEKTYKTIFNINNLYMSLTATQDDIETIKASLKPWLALLNNEVLPKQKYEFNFTHTNEAFIMPGKVQYVAKGYSYAKLGMTYNANVAVMNTVTSLDYLWNKIRVQGGAYGAMFKVTPDGTVVTNSYRDPNLAESIIVYDNIYTYLKNLDLSERELTKYIIGTIRNYDQPKTPSKKSWYCDYYFFMNKTQKDTQLQRDQILATKLEDIKSYSDMMKKIMDKNLICVFGSETKIKENKDMFNRIINIFE